MKRGRPTPAVFLCVALILALGALALAGCGEKKEETPAGTTGTAAGDAAQLASCQANLRTIDAAVLSYASANGKNPTSIQALVPEFLRSVPKEPMGGTYSLKGGKAVCSKGHTY